MRRAPAMPLEHETLASPTEALWHWLHLEDYAFPDRYLAPSGHLKAEAARWTAEWCRRILAGAGGPAGEDLQALPAVAVAFAEGYGLDELAGWAELAPSAPGEDDVSRLDDVPEVPTELTPADRRYWSFFGDLLVDYVGICEDRDCLPGLFHSGCEWLGPMPGQPGGTDPAEDPFCEVALPTARLWPVLDQMAEDWPERYLDGAGHLAAPVALEMARVVRRIRAGAIEDRQAVDDWPALPSLVRAFVEAYGLTGLDRGPDAAGRPSEDEDTAPEVLSQVDLAGLQDALLDYLNARPATLGLAEAFAGEAPRLFDGAGLSQASDALVRYLAGSGAPGRCLDDHGHLRAEVAEEVTAVASKVIEGEAPPGWPSSTGPIWPGSSSPSGTAMTSRPARRWRCSVDLHPIRFRFSISAMARTKLPGAGEASGGCA